MKATYIDHMGTDLSVVNAARVSFGKTAEWEHVTEQIAPNVFETTQVLSKADERLIQLLARGCTSGDWDGLLTHGADQGYNYSEYGGPSVNDPYRKEFEDILNHIRRMPPHWTPFAHTAITIHLKMPIFVARQIMKHTTGMVYNEVSRRYVDSNPEVYIPKVWRKRADNVKQGSSDEPTDWPGGMPYELPTVFIEASLNLYNRLVNEEGVAPEQARLVLPQATYTEVVATGNLYAWANMYIQRTDSHAQRETQVLAKQIGEVIKPLFPVSWKALTQ